MTTPIDPQPAAMTLHADADPMWDPNAYTHAVRVGKMFACSNLVPEHFRINREQPIDSAHNMGRIGDATIAVLMSRQLNESPLLVFQAIVMIKGNAGWKSTYMIARANSSGVFATRLNWRTVGTGDAMEVTCYAKRHDGEEVSATVSMKMARDEGWTSNSKYKTMPEQMLKYRSAAFLVRLHAPDVMLGYQTAEEVEDVAAAREAPRARTKAPAPHVDTEVEPAPSVAVTPQAPAEREPGEEG